MGKCVTVTVVGTPKLEVVDVSVDKTRISLRDTVKITAIIKNTGEARGTEWFDVYVDGYALGLNKSITLDAGKSGTLEWIIEGSRIGVETHSICVDTIQYF